MFVTFVVMVNIVGWPETRSTQADDVIPPNPPRRWWKGNIHTHSLWSDGNDFPEMIAEWYRTRGYNFLALSDHNVLSEGVRWKKHKDIITRGGPTFGPQVLQKYLDRFGPHWVETRGTPGMDDYEVRLKPLDEFRSLVEQRGQFIMMTGEEITDSANGLPVHMNATNLRNLIPPLGGSSVRAAMTANLRAAHEQARKIGREILVHLNHPNYGYAITADDLAAVLSEQFFEVYNGHPSVNHIGDDQHSGTERMWDVANTVRLSQAHAAPLMGLATDDSHDYHHPHGKQSQPGRGWIVVRARHLTPESIVRAVKQGEFYSSSGVQLRDIRFDDEDQSLQLQIEDEEGVSYSTQFVGTLAGYNTSNRLPKNTNGESADGTERQEDAIGVVLLQVEGNNPTYRFSGKELYVRAVVTSSRSHSNPSFNGQFEQAWTQPVGWRKRLEQNDQTQ